MMGTPHRRAFYSLDEVAWPFEWPPRELEGAMEVIDGSIVTSHADPLVGD